MTQWKCLCLSCRCTFILSADRQLVVCPGCRREFGSKERQYDYSYSFGEYERYKQKRKEHKTLSDTHFEGTAEYCIVPWIRNPEPKIIPDRKFHEWYEDMKQFTKTDIINRKFRAKYRKRSGITS